MVRPRLPKGQSLRAARSLPAASTLLVALIVALGGCTGADAAAEAAASTPSPSPPAEQRPLVVGAIPDQDPHELQRLHGLLASYLEERLEVDVEYVPVTDYTAAVTLFRSGDLDLVWFGGLTGVQARRQTPGAEVIAQRDIDREFRSVFIVNTATGLDPVEEVAGLAGLRGRRFTFGSESSTSGRLMPQYFLDRAGVSPDDFAGEPGYAGSHDRTIELVASGSYEAGVLNEQVWRSRLAAGEVDEGRVRAFLTTPTYADYHWLLGPAAITRHGAGFGDEVQDALLALSPDEPDGRRILELFGAERFVAAEPADHARIEQVAESLGLLR